MTNAKNDTPTGFSQALMAALQAPKGDAGNGRGIAGNEDAEHERRHGNHDRWLAQGFASMKATHERMHGSDRAQIAHACMRMEMPTTKNNTKAIFANTMEKGVFRLCLHALIFDAVQKR